MYRIMYNICCFLTNLYQNASRVHWRESFKWIRHLQLGCRQTSPPHERCSTLHVWTCERIFHNLRALQLCFKITAESFVCVPKVQNKVELGPCCHHQVLFVGWGQALYWSTDLWSGASLRLHCMISWTWRKGCPHIMLYLIPVFRCDAV